MSTELCLRSFCSRNTEESIRYAWHKTIVDVDSKYMHQVSAFFGHVFDARSNRIIYRQITLYFDLLIVYFSPKYSFLFFTY